MCSNLNCPVWLWNCKVRTKLNWFSWLRTKDEYDDIWSAVWLVSSRSRVSRPDGWNEEQHDGFILSTYFMLRAPDAFEIDIGEEKQTLHVRAESMGWKRHTYGWELSVLGHLTRLHQTKKDRVSDKSFSLLSDSSGWYCGENSNS